jgi:hypothetical protein
LSAETAKIIRIFGRFMSGLLKKPKVWTCSSCSCSVLNRALSQSCKSFYQDETMSDAEEDDSTQAQAAPRGADRGEDRGKRHKNAHVVNQAKLLPYDAILLVGPSIGKDTAVGFVVCPVCADRVRKSAKLSVSALYKPLYLH